jgi:hypothetical protein
MPTSIAICMFLRFDGVVLPRDSTPSACLSQKNSLHLRF